ncbi:conserved hypothetical protein [Histoplasma capsulatum var. duboisii H88]|uniref:Uncharacterized protein n=1 Tax=Ajellomyces capsulatus (strain H88) TaxID=544711 RepID=F0UQK8_AJEC8|nr:conserved hypothetical protein [Histoplasma capsulatum var. duboisii H88]
MVQTKRTKEKAKAPSPQRARPPSYRIIETRQVTATTIPQQQEKCLVRPGRYRPMFCLGVHAYAEHLLCAAARLCLARLKRCRDPGIAAAGARIVHPELR